MSTLTLIAVILLIIGNLFYGYRCLLGTKGMIDQYGFGDAGAFPVKLTGSFVTGLGLILMYLLATGIDGSWEIFAFGFIQAAILTVVGYQTLNSHWVEVEGVKATPEAYIAPAIFAVLNAVVLYSASDLLYA